MGGRVVDRSRPDLVSDAVLKGFELPGAGAQRRALRAPVKQKWEADTGPAAEVVVVGDQDLSVEVAELRTVSSKTYQNPDGTRTVVLYPAPVHAIGAKGEWVDVDPTARPDAGGFIADGGTFTSRFGGPGVDGAGLVKVTLGGGGGVVSIGLDGASPASVADAKGSRVTWRNVVPGVDYMVDQRVGELKSNVVLNGPRASGRVSFTVTLPAGVTAVQATNGRVLLVDKSGRTVAEIPVPVAFDANGRLGAMTMA